MLALTTITFAFPLWLGLYLIGREPRRPLLRRAGLGLVCYAAALATAQLAPLSAGAAAPILRQLFWLLIFAPAVCWTGALLLLPEAVPFTHALDRAWRYGLVPLVALGGLGAALAGLLVAGPAAPLRPAPGFLLLAALVLLPLLGALALVVRHMRTIRPARPAGLLVVAALFFALGSALLLLPFDLLPRWLAILALGLDLELLGLAIALLDAFDLGETLWPDIVRSFVAAAAAALLFGLPAGLVIIFSTGVSAAMVALLLTTVASAVAVMALADPLAALLDRLAFRQAPRLRAVRADLRAAASALPRLNPGLDATQLDETEFARLTRRALSHYGDLARLSASPLVQLPLVAARLAARSAPDDPLERAAELKALLAESINRLKPRGGGDFGTADEWRHYNALYFPYVAGLKPYSQRASHNGLDPATRAALAWFRAAVPERTLYNWQNAAARLVAQDLRRQNGQGDPAA